MWGSKNSSKENSAAPGGDFETAATRVTAQVEDPAPSPGADMAGAAGEGEALIIRPEWGEDAARYLFMPFENLHPAYALTDEEAQAVGPKLVPLMQALADRYAPALIGRVANRHPELFDALAALAILGWQKWRYVSKLRHLEAMERARMAAENQQPREAKEAEAFAAAHVSEVPSAPVVEKPIRVI